MSRQRADLVLVARGYFTSRDKAQEAIALGLVRVDGNVLAKASMLIDDDARVEATPAYPWVSRGGVKLGAALDAFGFDPEKCICLDVGASTGGFTDVLLSRGAAKIYAVDVGRGQLSEKLRDNPRVIMVEATDARSLSPSQFSPAPNFVTCDVSFISLRLILPKVLALAATGAKLVALIKPQFEVGPHVVVKGIVKDEAKHREVCDAIVSMLKDLGLEIVGLIPSPIDGSDGNREFLVGATKIAP